MSGPLDSSDDLSRAFLDALHAICKNRKWAVGFAYWYDAEVTQELIPTPWWYKDASESLTFFKSVIDCIRLERGQGLAGRALKEQRPVWIRNAASDGGPMRAALAKQCGLKSGYALPVYSGRKIVAILEFYSKEVDELNQSHLDFLSPVIKKLGLLCQRAVSRPFRSEEAA